ncbi:class I adenylate-forming enzyme family protein [Geodermatophilus sp. TF02-6]|uniref:AMP-binding protein n=1 Tax=Geodermatophilus sp. TF02-6 TaxID=2250575 RepID=UPI00131464A5|nr:class I adenylate-forming enzyme family protein [Geodermatophilus sp. TF02-6]
MPDAVCDVAAAADPVAAVLEAHARGGLIALRTSGTTSRPRSVVRTVASWVDSFPAVSRLTGIGAASRVWVPGPLSATMNLFAAVHARAAGAALTPVPDDATHAHLTPAVLARCLDAGTDLRGRHVVVAGDRLADALARRAAAAGVRTSHYYGAAELSFVAWGSHASDLRVFPGVAVRVRGGEIWARSPFLARGYAGRPGPLRVAADGFATVGDRGSLAGGVLTVAGRGGGALVTAGATVLLADVEQVLGRATGGEVVVVGVEHPRLGAVVAAVLPHPGVLRRARAAARAELSRAQRPVLWFVEPDPPLTAAGKVDRAALGERAAAGRLARLPGAEPPVER